MTLLLFFTRDLIGVDRPDQPPQRLTFDRGAWSNLLIKARNLQVRIITMTTILRATSEHLGLIHPLFCDYRAFYRLERREDAAQTFLAQRLKRQDSAIL